MIFASYSALDSDTAKLLFFALAIIVLFMLVRNFSRRNESPHDFPAPTFSPDTASPGSDRAAIEVHPPMRFQSVVLRTFYMREFDVMKGPPDPFEFVDELTAEVEHLETGEKSTWNFTIGTPAGFARLLEGKEWESFFSPEVFVIRKYELEMVREMVVEHISDVLNASPEGKRPA